MGDSNPNIPFDMLDGDGRLSSHTQILKPTKRNTPHVTAGKCFSNTSFPSDFPQKVFIICEFL
jgi:hypothetical protein